QSPYDEEIPALRFELQNNSFKHPDLVLDLAAPQAFSRLQIQSCDFCGSDETISTDTTEAPAEAPAADTGADQTPVTPTVPAAPVYLASRRRLVVDHVLGTAQEIS